MRVRGRGRGTVARPRLWLCAALGLFAVMPAFAGGTAPETVLTAVEPDPTNDTTGDFQFSADIPGSTFECSVDASAFAACVTPFHTAVLADGTHAFAVRAKEPGGVVDPSPATHSWRVDTVRPDTSITSGPSGTVNSSTAVFEFESPEAGVTFNCTRDGSAPFGCTSPTTFTNVADGAHTFTVRAIDGAGNVDLTPAARSWTVDASSPTLLFGRETGNDIVVVDPRVSRQHARIELRNGLFYLTDSSTNGTYLLEEGAAEHCIKRDDFILGEKGYIGCGFSVADNMSGAVAFALG